MPYQFGDPKEMNRRFLDLLRSRADLTEDQRQEAIDRYLRGEKINLPAIDPTLGRPEEPNWARTAARVAAAPTGLPTLYDMFGEQAKQVAIEKVLPPAMEAGRALESMQVAFPGLAVGLRALEPGGRFEEPDAGKALSAIPATFAEMGYRLLEGGSKFAARFAPGAPKGEGLERFGEQVDELVGGLRTKYDRAVRGTNMLGPSDVTEEAGARAVFPEEGVGQEVLTEVFRLVDPDLAVGGVQMGAAGAKALAGLAIKGGFLAGVLKASGGKALRRRALKKAIDESQSEFAKRVARSANQDVDAVQLGAFIDAVEETRIVKAGADPDYLAGFIDTHGMARAKQSFHLSDEEAGALEAALGGRKPSDFGRRLERGARAEERAREELVSLLSTGDTRTELLMLGNKQKAASIVARELTEDEVRMASKLNLKVSTVNASDLPKKFSRLRVIWNPELIEPIWRGMKRSRDPLTRSAAEFGKTPEQFVTTLARKNPRQLRELSTGGLQSDFAGAVRVEVQAGGRTVMERVVNGADAVSQADLMLRQLKTGEGLAGAELEAAKSVRRSKIGPSVLFHGRKIEDLTKAAGVSEPMLRRIQAEFNELGLQPLESTTLAGALTGTADPFARANVLHEAARTMHAAKPRKFPTVEDAARKLDEVLRKIDKDLPPNARFFRYGDEGPVPPPPPGPSGEELVRSGQAYWDPVEMELKPVRTPGEAPPYAVTDPAQIGKPTIVQGERLDALSHAEADNLVRHGHKHPPIPLETRTETVTRKLLGTGEATPEELVLAQAAANDLVKFEDAARVKATELSDVQLRRGQISKQLEELDAKQWEAVRNKDDDALEAVHREMEGYRDEMGTLREQARKVDSELEEAFGQSDVRIARYAKKTGRDPGEILAARSSTSPEMTDYARGREAYVAAARRLEGKTEAQAVREFEDASKPDWGQNIPPDAPTGPNNPTMGAAAYEGYPMDVDDVLRRDKEVTWTARNRILAGILRSPTTGIPRSLGAHKLATQTEVQVQRMMAYVDQTENTGVLRRRLLRDENDRFIVGRIVEGDANAIPRADLDEFLDNVTPRAKAMHRYLASYHEAAKKIADHAQVPAFRRMREYFRHRNDSKGLMRRLAQEATEARKAGDVDLLRKVENEIETWRNNEIEWLNMMDQDHVPKLAHYGPLNERMDHMADWIKNPEEMLRAAEIHAGRYRFLKETLPEWDKVIKQAGGETALVRHGEKMAKTGKVVAKQPEFAAVVDRLVEGRRQLWQPPDKFTDLWRRTLTEKMQTALGQKVFAKLNVDPEFFSRMAGWLRKAGFVMHIGGRTMTALVNLITLPTHTMLRMHPKDVTTGTAQYLADMVLSGDMKRGLPGFKHLAGESPKYGGGLSPVHALYKDSMAGFSTHWWEVGANHTDASFFKKLAKGTGEAAFDTLSLFFRSTESVVRGSAFYAEAGRAMRALDEFRLTGKLKDEYLDGWIAPAKVDLEGKWKLMRQRLPELRRKAANYQDLVAKGETPKLEPQSLAPDQLARLERIMAGPGSDLEKAKEFFDAERGIREALALDDPSQWVKDRAIASMDETQFTYNRLDRPRYIANYAPWAEVATQFLDFTRKELEFFFQRLGVKGQLAFLGILYAIGGPRALPLLEWTTENVPNALGGDALAEAMDDFEKDSRLAGLTAPSNLNIDVAGRLKFNLPLPALRRGKRGQGALAKTVSFLGGPPIAPFAEIASSMSQTASDVRALAESGEPIMQEGAHPGQARIQTGGPRAELRQTVSTEHLGPFGAVGDMLSGFQPTLNLPSQGLRSMADVFEQLGGKGIAAGLGVAAESLAFRQAAGRPGHLEVPGDRILAVSGWLRDMVRASHASEKGVTMARGRAMSPLKSEIGRKVVQYLGATPATDILTRREISRISKEAEVPARTRNKAIDYFVENHTPDGRRATPREILNRMSSLGYLVTEGQIRDRIFGRDNPLSGRFVSTFDKEQKHHVYERQRMKERLLEDIEDARAMGNEATARAAMREFNGMRRAFYEREVLKAINAGKPWSRELQSMLVEDLREFPDPGLHGVVMQAMTSGFKTLGGKYKTDMQMFTMQMFARNNDQQGLIRWAEVESRGDPIKRDDLIRIGLYLMELNEQGMPAQATG